MNEQQMADLFTEQLDHLLAGETVEAPIEELSGLLDLGRQFTQVGFRPGPAAQATFYAQLAGWFGSAAGVGSTVLGLSKGVFVAVSLAAGAGIAAVALFGLMLLGGMPDIFEGETPPSRPPAMITPNPLFIPATTPSEPAQTTAPTTEEPEAKDPASARDSVPDPPPSPLGDTIPVTSEPVTATVPITPVMATPPATDLGAGGTPTIGDGTAGGPAGSGDADRGHGNDPDRIDEDNPGNSSGAGSGSDGHQSGSNNNPGGDKGGTKGGGKNN